MPTIIDVHLGKRVRRRRLMLGLTQRKLAIEMGLRFQQIQKLECAEHRISAGRLAKFAHVLRVPITYFYEDWAADEVQTKGDPSQEEIELYQQSLALAEDFRTMPQADREMVLRHVLELKLGTDTRAA